MTTNMSIAVTMYARAGAPRALTLSHKTTERNEEQTFKPEHLFICTSQTPRQRHVNTLPRARTGAGKEAEVEPSRSRAG